MRRSALFIAALVFLAGCYPQDGEEEQYVSHVNAFRAEKDSLFLEDKSPLTEDQIADFSGLHYFDVDPAYRVSAILEKYVIPDTVVMKTTTERAPEYIKYGKVTFELQDKKRSLIVFQNVRMIRQGIDTGHLFIPFRDQTSGDLTYGGGRYIDSELPFGSDSVVLDFNKAYNPYCTYNHKYSCVLPPSENHLTLAIHAGEKLYDH